MARPWFGETPCAAPRCRGSAEPCPNVAKWWDGAPLCSVHCGAAKHPERAALAKNPDAAGVAAAAERAHAESVERRAAENREAGRPGRVEMARLRMRRTLPPVPGWRQVFPNRRGAMPTLSPMVMPYRGRAEALFEVLLARRWTVRDRNDFPEPTAPPPAEVVVDGEPRRCRLLRLPDFSTIENAHQQAKAYIHELADENARGEMWPGPEFWANYVAMAQAKPERHKFSRDELKGHESAEAQALENYNIPEFSCRADRHGRWRRFTYIEARLFYARAYEKEARLAPAFGQLLGWVAAGYDLQICGYDAWPVDRDLYAHYCDPGRPFGHEACLLALLTIHDPHQLPWAVYAREHPETYEGF